MKTQQPTSTTQSPQRPGGGAKQTNQTGKRAPGSHTSEQKGSAASGTTLKQLSKQDQLAAMLVRDEGATIAQMIAATGWLPHTVRAALTGLKKKGYAVESDKVDGVRTYRAVAP